MAEVAPESNEGSLRFLGFYGQGGLQLIGGLVIGLIALYSSYDHVNFFSSIHLNQQWGVWLIVASLAVSLPRFQGQCLESCFYTDPMKTNDHNECPFYATPLQR